MKLPRGSGRRWELAPRAEYFAASIFCVAARMVRERERERVREREVFCVAARMERAKASRRQKIIQILTCMMDINVYDEC